MGEPPKKPMRRRPTLKAKAPRPAAANDGPGLDHNAVGERHDPTSPIAEAADERALDAPPKPVRRTPATFKQSDVSRAIGAAQARGLVLSRVEIDPRTAKIVLVVKGDDDTETTVNPFDHAPLPDEPARRTRKTK
jgi:hypothetical protein